MNNNFYPLLILGFCFIFTTAAAQQTFSVEQIIERAKAQSPASKQAETRKENRYWSYRLYKTNYNPQLRLFGNIPQYTKMFQTNRLDNGTIVYQSVEQTNSVLSLSLEQPIGLTGGTIAVNTGFNNFKDYELNIARWSGSVINISLEQPLFAFNPLKWDRKTEPLRYEESKREYVEQMEFISREAVNRFFNVLQQQVNVQIAKFNLANNDTIYKIEQGRYNIGTTSQDKLLQVELQLLRSRQALAQANLALETARLQLRSFIGLTDDTSYELVLPETIPQFEVTVDEALLHGKQNRAAFIAFERRRIETDREVAQARGQRYGATLNGTFGLNNSASGFNQIYDNPTELRVASMGLSLPIMDWGRNKSRMRTAIANKKLNDYIVAQDEINFEQEIMTQVRQFEMLRLQIEITKKSDEVASERYNVAQNRYLIGKIDVTNLNIALEEKDNAKQSYIQALKDFWTAYFDLRRLTLYDFASKRLLYTPEK